MIHAPASGTHRLIQDRNIICIASNWFYDPTSKHHVMRILSERNHVVWVNYHGSRWPRIGAADLGAAAAKLRQFADGPRRVSDSMTVLTPLVVPMPGNRAAAALNRRLLVAQIRAVLQDLPPRPVQLWSFAPDVDYLCGRFDEERVVYYCVDEFSEFNGYDREATLAAERRMAAKSDLVVTTSQSLYDAKRGLNEIVALVTHGVDHEHFAQAGAPDIAPPQDIANLPRPVLGFWGLIQDWLDVDLLHALATARPEWSIVLIGEVATNVDRLRPLPNVHLIGRRPYADLPAYARGFDLGLIPFRVNDLTRAVNPIKLREYLSAGLPVVSTALPEVACYGDHVAIAKSNEQFIEACTRIVDAGDDPRARAARQAAMRSETWESKVEELSELVTRSARTTDQAPCLA